ncbi:HNH endonuclease signature motif containing protein [Arthrobacter sp. HLT1-21]
MAVETADQMKLGQDTTPPSSSGERTISDVRPGVSGSICLFREDELTPERAIETLTVLESLIGWAQAMRAKVITVVEAQVRDEARNTQGLDGWVDPAAAAKLAESMTESLAAAEIACALRLPDRTALGLLQDSIILCRDFPATLEALTWGKINYPQALTIVEEATLLPSTARVSFEAALLERAPEMTRAHQPDQDGMCWISAHLAAEIGIGIHNMLTALAQQCQGPDQPRTLTQLRADIFSDLLTGRSALPGSLAHPAEGAPTARPSVEGSAVEAGESIGESGAKSAGGSGAESSVEPGEESAVEPGEKSGARSAGEPTGETGSPPQPSRQRFTGPEVLVTIDAATLAGLTDHNGTLEGYGPLSPDVARGIAAVAGTFTPLLTDDHGNLLAIGRKRRLPSPMVRRWLRVRDETCRFPGCRRSAANSEIDHLIPWAKVHDTHHANLAHLCRKHHRFKTLTRWNVVQDRTGWLDWTSPSGGKYTTRPAVDLAPPRSSHKQTAEQSPNQLPRDDPPPF